MGVKTLWQLLEAEGLLAHWRGSDAQEHRLIVEEVEGKVVAVDLAMWIMQARESGALAEHFTPEEAAAKVALERVRSTSQFFCVSAWSSPPLFHPFRS